MYGIWKIILLSIQNKVRVKVNKNTCKLSAFVIPCLQLTTPTKETIIVLVLKKLFAITLIWLSFKIILKKGWKKVTKLNYNWIL